MKILLLTQWYDPEPTFKGQLFAKSLLEQGHEVEVITGFPNYPGGKVYDGYKIKWLQKEVIDGVKVTRVPLYPSHDRSAKGRVLNYATFAASSTLYGIFGAKKADVIYVYHPPLTVGMAGALIGLFRRTPFVYDIQDMWPDTLKATGMMNNQKVLNIIGKICTWVYKRASHIVVLCPGFKGLLESRGVPADKVSVIYNWCDESQLTADPEAKKLLPEGFNIVFAGNMGPAQAMLSCIDAAEILAEKAPEVNLVMVGSGLALDDLKQKVADKGLNNVHFIPRMPMSKVGGVLDGADALLVHLKRDPLFKITLPSKTQAYMAMGKPVLMAVEGDGANLIEQADAGVSCVPEDPEALAEAVMKLYNAGDDEMERMGQNAKAFYHKELSLSVGTERFISLFKRIIDRRG